MLGSRAWVEELGTQFVHAQFPQESENLEIYVKSSPLH